MHVQGPYLQVLDRDGACRAADVDRVDMEDLVAEPTCRRAIVGILDFLAARHRHGILRLKSTGCLSADDPGVRAVRQINEVGGGGLLHFGFGLELDSNEAGALRCRRAERDGDHATQMHRHTGSYLTRAGSPIASSVEKRSIDGIRAG